MLINIILYLLQLCYQLFQQNRWLVNFICRYIPLKQWAFDDSYSPICVKPFVDTYPYDKGSALVGDETYIKVRGIKGYVWFIMNADNVPGKWQFMIFLGQQTIKKIQEAAA